MATTNLYATGSLLDLMNQIGADGNIMAVAEVMNKACPMFKAAPFVEANKVTQHMYQRRFSLPSSEIIRFNKGVGGNVGSFEQIVVEIQARGNRPWYDKRLVNASPNPAVYRSNHSRGVVEGIGQDIESDIIYGSVASGTCAFDGLSKQLNALTKTMVRGAGGTGSYLSSMYIIAWNDPDGVYFAFPRGSKAGIIFEDKGESVKDMSDGSRLDIYEDYVEASVGLCIGDMRAIARVANIDTTSPTGSTFNEEHVIYLLNQMPAGLRTSAMGYVSRKVMAAIEMRVNAKVNVNYTSREVFGSPVNVVCGMPVFLDEVISEAETVVS